MSAPTLNPKTTRQAFLISGLVGMVVGALYGAWHLGLEAGQAISGIIEYPPILPYAWYFREAWTFIHQGSALLLMTGIDMASGSVLLSILSGIMHVQGLTLIAYGLSGRVLPSLQLALVAMGNQAYWYNPDYPLELFTGFSNGDFANASLLYITGLAAIGWRRGAGFLLGFQPAIHITTGAWSWGICLLTLLLFRYLFRQRPPRDLWIGFGLGVAATLASLLYHLLTLPPFPPQDPAEVRRHFEVYMTAWEFGGGHRTLAVDPLVVGLRLLHTLSAVLVLGLAAWGLTRLRAWSSAALLTAFAISGICASGLFILYKAIGDQLPLMVSVIMPGRFFNPLLAVGLMLFSGLLLARMRSLGAMALLFCLYAMAILANKSPKLAPEVATLAFIAAALAFALLLVWEKRPFDPARGGVMGLLHELSIDSARFARLAKVTFLALLIMATINSGLFLYRGVLRTQGPRYPAWQNVIDMDLMRTAGSEPGIIATTGNPRHIAAWTGRAPLIEGTSLNIIPYTPSAGPSMSRMLPEVYGIDYFAPPGEVFTAGGYGLAPHSGKKLWHARTPGEWAVLAEKYGLSFALTPKSWHLQLPLVKRGEKFALFRMP